MLSVDMDRERIYKIVTVRFPCGIGGKLISKIDLETREITAEYSVGMWDESGSLIPASKYQLTFPEDSWRGAKDILLNWANACSGMLQQDYEVDELDLSECQSVEAQIELMRMAGYIVSRYQPSGRKLS